MTWTSHPHVQQYPCIPSLSELCLPARTINNLHPWMHQLGWRSLSFLDNVTPGHTTHHCWTCGEWYEHGYLVTTEDTNDHQPGQITRSTQFLPQPSFTILDTAPPSSPSHVTSTPLCYGAFYIPLPEPTCPGGCHSECNHVPTPIRQSHPQPSPLVHTSYPEPFTVMSTNVSHLQASVPSPIILPQSHPIPPFRGSNTDHRNGSTDRRRRKRRQEEVLGSPESHGGSRKTQKHSWGLDGEFATSHQHSWQWWSWW